MVTCDSFLTHITSPYLLAKYSPVEVGIHCTKSYVIELHEGNCTSYMESQGAREPSRKGFEHVRRLANELINQVNRWKRLSQLQRQRKQSLSPSTPSRGREPFFNGLRIVRSVYELINECTKVRDESATAEGWCTKKSDLVPQKSGAKVTEHAIF